MRRRVPAIVCATVIYLSLVALVLDTTTEAQSSNVSAHWVSAWSTAMHAPLSFPLLPPTPLFENQTIRMVVRATIGVERVRIRLSNAFGTTALNISAAHIALAAQNANIVPESDHGLTFGGNRSVRIPPGAPVLSDAVDLKVPRSAEIAVR